MSPRRRDDVIVDDVTEALDDIAAESASRSGVACFRFFQLLLRMSKLLTRLKALIDDFSFDGAALLSSYASDVDACFIIDSSKHLHYLSCNYLIFIANSLSSVSNVYILLSISPRISLSQQVIILGFGCSIRCIYLRNRIECPYGLLVNSQ